MKVNPFNPTLPVDPKKFGGRKRELRTSLQALLNTMSATTQHLLITGERGIGKSSLISYTLYAAENKILFYDEELEFNYLTNMVVMGNNMTLQQFCTSIFKEIRKNIDAQNRIKGLFTKALEKISKLESISIMGNELKMKQENIEILLIYEFVNFIENIWDEINGNFKGILIVIDEADQIAKIEGFGAFFKAVVEKLYADDYKKILFTLAGIDGLIDLMFKDHNSSPRTLTPIKLLELKEIDSIDILNKTLDSTGEKYSFAEDTLRRLIHYSNGFPKFLQQIGYCIFEVDKDHYFDNKDLYYALKGNEEYNGAINILAEREFDRMWLTDIKSPQMREILQIIATFEDDIIERQKIAEKWSKGKTQLDVYLGRLVERGMLVRPKEIGEKGFYKITNRMFKAYIRLTTQIDDLEHLLK